MAQTTTERIRALSDPALIEVLESMLDEIRLIRSAFPGGDLDGHKRYHDEVILDMQERRESRRKLREKLIEASVWGMLVTVGAACWQYLKDHLK